MIGDMGKFGMSRQHSMISSLLAAAALSMANTVAFTTPALSPASQLRCGYPCSIRPGRSPLLEVASVGGTPKKDLRRSVSFLATAVDDDIAIDPAVLRRLDGELEQMARRRRQYEDELNSVQSKLQEANTKMEQIQTKRKAYLDGGQLGAVFGEEQNFTESTVRSAVKALMWRVIAGMVTFLSALQFSKSLSTALKVVGSDFFSKAFTMFIGERLMNKSQAGRKSGGDDVGRSLAKALIWRLFAICNTLTMALFVAKDMSIASKIAGSDAIFKTALMFGYERVWAKVEWGKDYQIEYSI